MAWEDRPYNRDEPPRVRVTVPMPGRLTIAIMAVCLVLFLFANVLGYRAIGYYGALTFIEHLGWKQPWRWLTYAYLHGSGAHIFWNLLTLYFFLPPLERAWGWKRALVFYTLGTIAAGITFAVMCIFYPFNSLVGASGGVLAALGACAYLFPEMMLFMVIPIRVAAALIGILFLFTISGDRDAADAAHLGGLIFGFFAPYYGRRFFGAGFFSQFAQRWEQRRRVRKDQSERDESEAIDRILRKVHTSGMNSLSRGEKKALQRATDRQRASESARAARRG